MSTQLSEDLLDFIIDQNNISRSENDSYTDKINKLKNAKLLRKDYGDETSLSRDISEDPSFSIQDFFKDGKYNVATVGTPSCTFINGFGYAVGSLRVSSSFQCNDPTQPFLQKNIIAQTNDDINRKRLSIFTFNINQNSIIGTNLGGALKGTYTILGNKLYSAHVEGYANRRGKIEKNYYTYERTPAGYFHTVYYLDDNNNYQVYIMTNQTYLSE
jgi:hypothetical protein